jgi:hypothetical protein
MVVHVATLCFHSLLFLMGSDSFLFLNDTYDLRDLNVLKKMYFVRWLYNWNVLVVKRGRSNTGGFSNVTGKLRIFSLQKIKVSGNTKVVIQLVQVKLFQRNMVSQNSAHESLHMMISCVMGMRWFFWRYLSILGGLKIEANPLINLIRMNCLLQHL